MNDPWYIVVAIAAIAGAIFAGISVIVSSYSAKEARLNRRAYLNVHPRIDTWKQSHPRNAYRVQLNTENIGLNPLSGLNIRVVMLEKGGDDAADFTSSSTNDIDPQGKFVSEIHFTARPNQSAYIYIAIKYKDVTLRKEYQQQLWYLWREGATGDGSLFHLPSNEAAIAQAMLARFEEMNI